MPFAHHQHHFDLLGLLTWAYRIRKARVLVLGVSGLTVEASKNLVLAGVHSLTLCDDMATQTTTGALSLFAPAEPGSNVRQSSLIPSICDVNVCST